jgi:hypothetical protein
MKTTFGKAVTEAFKSFLSAHQLVCNYTDTGEPIEDSHILTLCGEILGAARTTAPPRMKVRVSDIKQHVGYDEDPDPSYAVAMAEDEGATEELKAIERGDLVSYYCKATVNVTIPSTTEQLPDYDTDRGYAGDKIIHNISSPGLWNIYARSDDDPYFDEVFAEERKMLVHMLTTMGIEVVDELVLCRYADCPEGNSIATAHEQVTCPRCRATLGLPPLES